MTYYPGTTPTFTTKTNKVDLVDAAHINSLQDEIVAMATEFGTNISENRTTLKERLNSMMDGSGAIAGSNGFPDGVLVPSYPHQSWYRTDLDAYYIRNNANTTWNLIGQTLSNYLFQYSGVVKNQETASASLVGTASPQGFRYIQNSSSSYGTVWMSKFKKLAGISTITIYAHVWVGASDGQANIYADVGGVTGNTSGAAGRTYPEWVTFDLNVSGLTTGNYYDVIIQLKDATANNRMSACGGLIGFGS